jgi:hypothetical protein
MDQLEMEIKRHGRRRDRFIKEGLSDDEAWDLADKMFDRDRDVMDDRRLCFECNHYHEKSKLCQVIKGADGKSIRPLRFILQRCPLFQLKEFKK